MRYDINNPDRYKNCMTAALRLGSNLPRTVSVRARASVRTWLPFSESRNGFRPIMRPLI